MDFNELDLEDLVWTEWIYDGWYDPSTDETWDYPELWTDDEWEFDCD